VGLLLAVSVSAAAPPAGEPAEAELARVAADLSARARSDPTASLLLTSLVDDIGPRLGGSPELGRAVGWAEEKLRRLGLDRVWREDVMVPHWERGVERLVMLAPERRELAMLGLGGSVGTTGIEAPVVVVGSFEELSPAAAGAIVLFDVPMGRGLPALHHYATAARYRAEGASKAAAFGAVAALVRSMATTSLMTPHTGGTHYTDGAPRIPAAAVTVEDAEWIARLAARGVEVRVRLEMGAKALPDALSHNVLAEIRGSHSPDEIVLIGGHLDSWDVGRGAHDDGAGVAHVIAAMKLFRELPAPPRRTIRAVLFTNEENGLRGGKDYAARHGHECHVAAIETDLGAGTPLSWSARGSPEALAWLRRIAGPLGLPVDEGGSGADISPLEERGILCIGLRPEDGLYFAVHHTRADTLDKIDPASLAEGTAAVAGLAWLAANAAR
jgi:Zn-dependent M28 family amino/carboxypeptidase